MPSSTTMPRRAFLFSLLALSLPLAACGDSEPTQRAAFIAFLNERIVNKPGMHWPILSDDERKSFGPYAAQFDVIADFNHAMNDDSGKSIGGFQAMSQQVHSLPEMLGHKAELASLHDGMGVLVTQMKKQLAASDAARAAFPPQPNDLKTVYAAAYNRDVTGTVNLMLEIAPVLDDTLVAALNLIAFMERYSAKVKMEGNNIATSDPKLQPELNGLIAKLVAASDKSAPAKAKMQKAVTGE